MSKRFKITLNDEQKLAKEQILNNTVSLICGKAGSGKTLLACQIALDLLLDKKIEKIIITRPTITTKDSDIGYLKGNIKEKMDPFLQPIYQNMYQLYDKIRIDNMISNGIIEILPVAYMRGVTCLNSCVIVDEAQNISFEQMQMITTRIGLNSKMIICGDDAQIDLKTKSESGFKFLYNVAADVDDMYSIELFENHRHPIVDILLDIYAADAKRCREEAKEKKPKKEKSN